MDANIFAYRKYSIHKARIIVTIQRSVQTYLCTVMYWIIFLELHRAYFYMLTFYFSFLRLSVILLLNSCYIYFSALLFTDFLGKNMESYFGRPFLAITIIIILLIAMLLLIIIIYYNAYHQLEMFGSNLSWGLFFYFNTSMLHKENIIYITSIKVNRYLCC